MQQVKRKTVYIMILELYFSIFILQFVVADLLSARTLFPLEGKRPTINQCLTLFGLNTSGQIQIHEKLLFDF